MQLAPQRDSERLTNPYIVGRPLAGASSGLYVGRDDLFAWLEENITETPRPNALLLHGRRRIGKTSSLYQLVEGERGKRLRGRGLFPAFIDLQRLAGRPTDEWLRRLAHDIGRRAGLSGDGRRRKESAYAALDRCLDDLELAAPDDSLILVALDEFEQLRAGIDSGALDPEVLPFLRSQMQHRTRVAFLVCGSPGLLDPFYSPIVDLTARFEIGELSFDETEQLMRQPVAGLLSIGDAAVEAIWRFTSGHPFLVQTICHRLISHANRRHAREVTGEDVALVVEQLDDEGTISTFVPAAQSVAMPQEGGPS